MNDEHKRVNKENAKIYGTDSKAAQLRGMKSRPVFLDGNFCRGVDPALDKMADEAIEHRREAYEVEAKACEYLKNCVEKK
jgi:hypothetical protein